MANHPPVTPDETTRTEQLFATLFQAHPWHGLPSRRDDGVNTFIEMVPADVVKYELDKPSGILRVDRPQRFSSLCPTLYGFIPQTWCGPTVAERCAERTGTEGVTGDGDPLDICVLTEKTFAHGNFLCHARPIGGLRMIDNAQADDKIIAVLVSDLVYGGYQDLADCPAAVVERLQHYFLSYKRRPGESVHQVRIAEVYDRTEALEVLRRSEADYRTHYGEPEARVAELRRLLGL